MTWDAAFDVTDVSFLQAVSWFSERVPITEDAFIRDIEQARRQAFWIAGVTSADIIRDVHESLGAALDKGIPFEEWQKEIGPKLERAWLGTAIAEGKAARTETILRNWAQNAYGRARWDQMAEPAVRRVRPYLMFDATRDSRTSESCTACDGTVLPADHPWFAAHRPPLHHRCRSGIRSLTAEKALRLGITETPPSAGPQEGFGTGDEYQGPDRSKFPRGAKPPKPPRAPPPRPEPQPPPPPTTPVKAKEYRRGATITRRVVEDIETENGRSALRGYVASSGGVNHYMRDRARGVAPADALIDADIASIRQELSKVRAAGGTVKGAVLRGEQVAFDEQWEAYGSPGAVVDFPAFISTTISADEASEFAGSVGRRAILTIQQDDGVPLGGLGVFGGGSREVLLEPGSYRVVHSSVEGDVVHVVLEPVRRRKQ